jgi:NAD(P)H-hydrate epimerase
MASRAAIRVGTGLVTAVTWEPQYQEMIMRLAPEVMTGYIPTDQAKWPRLLKDINKYNSIIIGPGLARSIRARNLVLEILNNFSGPIIIDADAINVLNLKDDKDVFSMRSAPTIMTPHFGEFARFANLTQEEISKRPVDYLKRVVNETHCAIVLKGPCTYLGLTTGEVYFNYSPNDGMAKGGAGDVLAGVLGGLMAQNFDHLKKEALEKQYQKVNQSLLFGVFIHTLSGIISAQNLGSRAMTAMSLIENLPEAFKKLDLESHRINS